MLVLSSCKLATGETTGQASLVGRYGTLQEEFETLTHEVRELRSAQEFDQKLLANRDEHVTTARSSLVGGAPRRIPRVASSRVAPYAGRAHVGVA